MSLDLKNQLKCHKGKISLTSSLCKEKTKTDVVDYNLT